MRKINWAMVLAFIVIALTVAVQYYWASEGAEARWPIQLPRQGHIF
jgi:hypothetical protein